MLNNNFEDEEFNEEEYFRDMEREDWLENSEEGRRWNRLEEALAPKGDNLEKIKALRQKGKKYTEEERFLLLEEFLKLKTYEDKLNFFEEKELSLLNDEYFLGEKEISSSDPYFEKGIKVLKCYMFIRPENDIEKNMYLTRLTEWINIVNEEHKDKSYQTLIDDYNRLKLSDGEKIKKIEIEIKIAENSIENIMNEAAILSARANLKKINMETIEEAITKVIAGIPKKSRIISDKEKKLVAYHEAGHAVIARSLPDFDPVHHVTIIPRGRAGGFTMTLPEEDVNYVTKRNMQDRLVELLGGRLAEEIVLDDISTGAQNDLERVSQIARSMVTKYAFSENLPSMSFGDSSDEVFLGRDFTTRRNYSEEVASQIDKEIEKIVSVAYDRCKSILTEHIDNLHSVANALIKFETLDKVQFEKAYNGEMDVSLEEVGDKAEV